MSFKVTVIGSGAATPVAYKYHSSHVLNAHEHYYLLDCGEGTQKGMLENGINPVKLKAIFISHLHGDHFYGLFPMLDTISLSQRQEALKVFAPPPFKKLVRKIMNCFNIFLSPDIEFVEVDSGVNKLIYENDGIEVITVPLLHRIPSVGYLIREKTPGLNIRKDMISRYDLSVEQIIDAKDGKDIITGDGTIPNHLLTYLPFIPRSYAYCTDTVFSEDISEMVKGTDLLYHEATFSAGDEELAAINGHSTTLQAAETALRANSKKLLIGHFSARYKDTSKLVEEAKSIFPDTEEATEGKTYEIILHKYDGTKID